MKEFEMFVVTHKEIFYKLPEHYVPIFVGKNNNIKKYISDNTGNNISEKNDNYCELTALYWLWKNYNLPRYVGISHYRRFFFKRPFYTLIDEKYVKESLKDYDVIQPYPYITESSIKQHFINSISGKEVDIDRLERLIKTKYPDYHLDYEGVMNSKSMSYLNMAILSKENYIQYCEWLFELLFEYEKDTDLTGYTKQEARIYGYLSEFLLNVWIKKNKLKVKYCNVILVEENKVKTYLKKIRCLLLDLKRSFRGELS